MLEIKDQSPNLVTLGGGAISQIAVKDQQVWPKGYKPNENTLLYLPFEDDLLDHSGKGVTTSSEGSPFMTLLNGVKCCRFNGSSILNTNVVYDNLSKTMLAWAYREAGNGYIIGSNPCGIFNGDGMNVSSDTIFNYYWYSGSSGGGGGGEASGVSGLKNHRHLYAVINRKMYVDAEYKGTVTGNVYSIAGGRQYSVGGHAVNSSCTKEKMTGYIKDVILEKGEWTDRDLLKYYNSVKNKFIS